MFLAIIFKILCSRGYSDQLAGLAAASIIVAGLLASFPLGFLAAKTGRLTAISKVGTRHYDSLNLQETKKLVYCFKNILVSSAIMERSVRSYVFFRLLVYRQFVC